MELIPGLVADDANTVKISFNERGVIKQTTTSLLVDIEDLISNIGGGLGLALGMSVYSTIECALDFVSRKLDNQQ